MLAPNPAPTPPEKPAKPAEQKRRTITLTNRRPVQIVETEWPVVAQGVCAVDGDPHGNGCPWPSWKIEIRVRQNRHGRVIIHANYDYQDEINEENEQTIRVGRLLNYNDDECKHLLAVGNELRERIGMEALKKYVTYALDKCFAELGPQII